MPPRVSEPLLVHPRHLCVCGFQPPTIASEKRHRKLCLEWKDRGDPRGLMISRFRVTRKILAARRAARRASEPRLSQAEVDAREAMVRQAGLTPTQMTLLEGALKIWWERRH